MSMGCVLVLVCSLVHTPTFRHHLSLLTKQWNGVRVGACAKRCWKTFQTEYYIICSMYLCP